GDAVKSGELLAEIETDKATMEYESYQTGTLLYIGAKAKESVPVNGVLAIIGEKNADWQTLLKANQSKGGAAPAAPAAVPSSQGSNGTSSQAAPAHAETASTNGRLKASPLAKKMAKDLGYDISR